jgi:predicted regulator of Ras-like GTPase activity (Roadblock/LC7/MglB family)
MKQMQEIVQSFCQDYGFTAVTVTDASGFPLASSAGGAAGAAPAAMAAMLQRSAEQVSSRVGLGTMQELTMYAEDGQRLVCRPFQAGDHTLILAVQVPPQVAYRRATNLAIRAIRQAWLDWRRPTRQEAST